jgi:hypothetical protein
LVASAASRSSRASERVGQDTAAAGQPGLDRPGRHPQLTGHLLDRQARQMVQHDHLPLAERQGTQRVVEVQQLGAQLGHRRRRAQSQQRHGPATQPSGGHGGQVQRHPPHPRLRAVVGAHLGPADIGAGVRLLEVVLGLGQVAGDGEQLPEQPLVGGGVEGGEAVIAHRHRLGSAVRSTINMPLGPIRFHRRTDDRTAARSGGQLRRTQTSTEA